MKPIIYLRSSFEPGGTESLLINIFNHPQNDIQFHYVFLKDGSLISKLNSKNNCYYRYFRRSNFDLRVVWKIHKLVMKLKSKSIHTHQPIELFFAALVKTITPGIQIQHTIHGYLTKKKLQYIERFLMLFANKIFTVSHATQQDLKKLNYPYKKIEVLYNAVISPPQITPSEKKKFKTLIKGKDNEIIIGMVGNFVWWKDQLTIVRAFNLLKIKYSQLKLVFIGKDGNKFSEDCVREAGENISEKVFFLGHLAEASKYISQFDVFIMSSKADTFGIVIIEALLNKIPVLASDIPVFKELSQNQKFFNLFKTSDEESLAEKITWLIENKDSNNLIEQSRIAYNYAIENYLMDGYIKKINTFYK